MIIDAIIKHLISPIISFIIKIFPTISLGENLLPYVVTAVGFFTELFSYISYFVPLKFFVLVILAKTVFYICQFIIRVIKFVGEVL